MWLMYATSYDRGPGRTIAVVDDNGLVRFLGPTVPGALAYIAGQGENQIAVEVEDGIEVYAIERQAEVNPSWPAPAVRRDPLARGLDKSRRNSLDLELPSGIRIPEK